MLRHWVYLMLCLFAILYPSFHHLTTVINLSSSSSSSSLLSSSSGTRTLWSRHSPVQFHQQKLTKQGTNTKRPCQKWSKSRWKYLKWNFNYLKWLITLSIQLQSLLMIHNFVFIARLTAWHLLANFKKIFEYSYTVSLHSECC